MGIQEELIKKYGSEVEGINAITEAIKGETDALDGLKETEWYNTKTEYNKTSWKEDFWNGVKEVFDEPLRDPLGLFTLISEFSQGIGLTDKPLIENNTTTHLEDLINEWNNQKINLPESGNKNVDDLMDELLTKGTTDWLSGDFTKGYDGYGTVTELKEKLGQIKAYATSQNNVDGNFLSELQSVLDYLQGIYEQDYQMASDATLYDKIKSDDVDNDYDEELNKLELLKSQYDEALLSGDDEKIKQYAESYVAELNLAMKLALDNGDRDVSDYFYNMFPAMKDVVKKINFQDYLSTDSSMQKTSKSLNDLDKNDILSFLTSKEQEKGEKAFKTIREKAIEDGVILNDSIEETEKLIDLLVEWGILKDKANEATDNNSAAPISFSKAWKALGTTGDEDQQKAEKEAKENLLELANAGKLTIEAFKDSSIATKFMKDTGLSADEATRKINKLIESTKQLSSMKTGITAITSAYDEKKDSKDKRVGSDTLKSLYETLGIDNSWSKKDLKVWEDYKNAATDASIPLKDFKKCQDDLATSYVNSNNFLANLTKDLGKLTENATKERQEYYDGLLAEMGITNAHQITTKLLADAKKYLGEQDDFAAEKGKKLTDASSEEIKNFIEVQGGADNVSFALRKLAIEKESCNAHVLDFSGDCSNLLSYVTAIGGTTEALEALRAAQNNDWKAVKEAGYDPKDTSSISQIEKDAKKEVEEAKKKLVKTNTNTTPGNKSDNSGKGEKGKDTDTKKTKQTFDWLERRISVLTDKLDFLRAKLENVFTVKKKNSIIDQEIKKTNKLIKTYQKQEKVYKKQANKSARSSKTQTGEKKSKLTGKKGKKIIKQIQNGQIKGSRKQLIKDYGEPTANAIEEYQNYWDKYQQARTNIQTAKKDKRELNIQKHQNRVDHYDALSSKYDAQIENKATAKEKNKLEDKKIKSTEKSYNQQIKIAKLEKDSAKVATLKAEKEAAIRDIKIQQQQNLQDEADAYRDMLDVQAENVATAVEKNALLQQERQYIASSYAAQIEAAKLEGNTAKQHELQAEQQKALLDNQIAQLQNVQDEADSYRDMLESQKENATTAADKNSLLTQEIQYINASYDAQIKAAQAQKDTALATQLQAEWQKALLDLQIEQLQNLSDEQSAQYDLNQQKEANADTAKEKNRYEADSRKNLKAQYDYEIQIAEKNGDLVEAEKLRLELAQKIEESYQKQIENIKEEYDLIIGMNDAEKSTIDSKIAALQANGYGIGTEVYERQMALDRESYRKSLEEIKRISAEMPNLTGDALKQAEIDLETEKQKVWGFQKALGEAQQTINDINLSKIERIGTYLEYYGENLEYIQDILSHSDFTLSDKDIGGLTTEGLANIAITFAQMSNNSEQVANIYDQIAEKRRQLVESNVKDDQLVAEIDELIQKAHDMEKANYDFGESIKDLVIESLNSLSDALDESISKYKDALQAQKDLYDYRRKVADQLKSIASLEKQLAALQGSDTEEARARIQKLQIQLEDEQQNLKDMEYEKYIQDQEEMLDKVSEDFQDFIANVADTSVSDICEAMRSAVSDNLDPIGTAIQNAFTESSEIGKISTSINELSNVIKDLDFSGNVATDVDENGSLDYKYTDDKNNKTDITVNNTDAPGTITDVKVNGKDIPLADKDVSRTEDEIKAATEKEDSNETGSTASGYTRGGNIFTGNSNGEEAVKAKKENAERRFVEQLEQIVQKSKESYNPHERRNGKGDALFNYLYEKTGKYLSCADEAAVANAVNKATMLIGTLEKDPKSDIRSIIYRMGNNSGEYHPKDFELGLVKDREADKLVSKLKSLGFSHGGVASELNKVALANGDDGWATLKRGESVLTPAQTEQFRKLTENLVPLNNLAENITALPGNLIPVNHPATSTTNVRNVDIHLDGSNVVDADSFIKTLHNPRVLKEVSSGVSSQLGTTMSNRLGRF